MKYFFVICMTTLLFNYSAFAQGKTTTHKVEKGETITQIALKYKTTPTAIYKINPDSQSGIQENQILSIPDGILQQKNNLVHIVGPKETLYGLATKYNVKIEALRNANEESLINGLKIGQELLIPKFSEILRLDGSLFPLL